VLTLLGGREYRLQAEGPHTKSAFLPQTHAGAASFGVSVSVGRDGLGGAARRYREDERLELRVARYLLKLAVENVGPGNDGHAAPQLCPTRGLKGRCEVMSVIGWIVLGLISGFIASKIVNKSGEGVVLDIVLGIVGAVVGGFLFNAVGAVGVDGFNIWSMFVAVLGAVVVLVVKHALMGRGRVHV
jgi:uncharacterized membrane protein YeaQ/YmgE (transglycosylase-associated protein family)